MSMSATLREGLDRAGQHGLARQHPVLLGRTAAGALAGAGGDDNDGDGFLGSHIGQVQPALRLGLAAQGRPGKRRARQNIPLRCGHF